MIANCLFYAGFIESWGSGTLRIAELARAAGLEIPEFVSSADEFEITEKADVFGKLNVYQRGNRKWGHSATESVALL